MHQVPIVQGHILFTVTGIREYKKYTVQAYLAGITTKYPHH